MLKRRNSLIRIYWLSLRSILSSEKIAILFVINEPTLETTALKDSLNILNESQQGEKLRWDPTNHIF